MGGSLLNMDSLLFVFNTYCEPSAVLGTVKTAGEQTDTVQLEEVMLGGSHC